MPSVVSRLLTPSIVTRREISRDADEWSIRLGALATLGQYDGLTFLTDIPGRIRDAHNVSGDLVGDAALKSAIDETRRSGATMQIQTTIVLRDDRVATTAMVAPLMTTEGVDGVLIALRVGRSFTASDALTASGVSELLALELARESATRRDEAHRRQAFALYELARVALFSEGLRETLQDVTALLTSALDHDLAQIWLLGSAGALELRAAKPREKLSFERMHPSDHDVLAEALHQRRLVRIGQGALRPWVPAETRELLVVPLADRARTVGVLVLGRFEERYEEADEELANVLSRFIARLVSRATTADRPNELRTGSRVTEPDADREWANEPQLAGS
jgi:hypothetical protein